VGCEVSTGHIGISQSSFMAAEYTREEKNGEESWGMIDLFNRKPSPLQLLQN